MKNLISIILILICGIIVYGQDKTGESLPKPTDNETASIYFYRAKEVTGFDNRNSKVNLDGKKIFEMKQYKWIGMRLAPGKYVISMRQKQAEMLLKVEAGKTYFIRVSEKAGGVGFNQSLTIMDEEQAVFQMRDLSTLESKKIFIKTEDIITEKPVGEQK